MNQIYLFDNDARENLKECSLNLQRISRELYLIFSDRDEVTIDTVQKLKSLFDELDSYSGNELFEYAKSNCIGGSIFDLDIPF